MTISNPVLRGFNPDPSICRVGADFFIATSTFEWYPGVQIHHSKNLVDWTLVSRPLDRPELLDMRGNPDSCGVWAPALSYADDRFWLTYTNVKRYDGNYKDTPNYLTWAKDITGPWADPVFLNSSGFDPSLFHDKDGRKYLVNMVWDHRASMAGRQIPEDFFGGIALQEFCPQQNKLVGAPKMIFRRSALGYTEAPHLFERKGWYYLVTAEGGTGYNHAITHARSRTIDGPYELHPDTHVLTAKDDASATLQRIGHGQFCALNDDQVIHSYLCSRPLEGRFSPLGREAGLEILEWDDAGWLYQNPKSSFQAYAKNCNAQHPATAEEKSYSFAQDSLPLDFQWLRSPEPDRLFSMDAHPEALRLFGREAIGSWFEQALVARRQTEHRVSVSVAIEFEPEDFQQMAGLVSYYNRHQFHYLYLSCDDDGQRRLAIQSCPGDWPEGRLEFPIDEGLVVPTGRLWLGLDIDHAELVFRYSTDGLMWHKIGPPLLTSALSDEGGRGEHANFTGNFIGMAAQDLTGQAKSVDFFDFQYLAKPGGAHL